MSVDVLPGSWHLSAPVLAFLQVKASYKLSEDFKKGPAKPKKAPKAKVRPQTSGGCGFWVLALEMPMWHTAHQKGSLCVTVCLRASLWPLPACAAPVFPELLQGCSRI